MNSKTKKSVATAVHAVDPLNYDLMMSVMIVSVTVNAFVLIGWITLQVTTIYDAEIAAFLFTR